MNTHLRTPAGRSRPVTGFSMIEILGVLAILAVLAVAISPNLIGEMDRAAHRREEAQLLRIAAGFEKHVTQLHHLPDHTDWAALVAAQVGESAAWVGANARGGARRLIIDPEFGVGPTGTNRPPFAQTWEGSGRVTHPRYLILTSLGADLPASVQAGFASSATAFAELWNLEEGHKPASWNWSGEAADLKLQRVDLTPLFHLVTLNSVDVLPGRYAVDESEPVEVTRSPISFYLLSGSTIGLLGTDSVSQSREIVDRTVSYSFEAGIWRGQLFAGIPVVQLTGSELEAVATSFLAAPENPSASTTTDAVYTAVQNYMSAYIAWALAGYPGGGSLQTAVQTAQATLATATTDIVTVP